MVRYGFLDAKAGFVGFGSRRLISQGFLGAKADLWLTAFGRSWLYRCQSRSFRPTFLPLETPVLPTALCQNSRIRHSPNSGTVRRNFMEESFSALEKQGKLYFFKSSQTSRERGNQRFRCVGFPSPLNPHPFLTPTRGAPLDPLCYASLFGTGGLISEFSAS